MKYTRENLIGVGVKTKNKAQSKNIVEKFTKLGVSNSWNGDVSDIGYYGVGICGNTICLGGITLNSFSKHFSKLISYEEFMNEDIILPDQKIEENYEIY